MSLDDAESFSCRENHMNAISFVFISLLDARRFGW